MHATGFLSRLHNSGCNPALRVIGGSSLLTDSQTTEVLRWMRSKQSEDNINMDCTGSSRALFPQQAGAGPNTC